ncbi:MAG: DUF4340 domain-containing protein [Desulfohalobiaceae bacterium]|nr:DUF4340 domain-containing protein [Desulfohalobiaceae bacterium]
MKLKKEYAIIVLVIIGLSLYISSRTSDRINYELPQPEPVNTKEVTRISLDKQGKVITLARENGQWTVGQKGYPARTGSIENLLETLDRFRISDLVSRSKNYARYSLDQESAIEVKARAGRDLVRSFRVGKQASTYRNSYVKLADEDVLSLYLDKGQENVKTYRGTSKENRFPFVLSRQKGKEIVEALNRLLNL